MIIYWADLLGTFAFAISGALAASEKRFDLFGAAFAGFVTAVGGGTLRDLLIGNTPVSWLQNPTYILVIIAGVIITFLFENEVMKWRKTLFLFDTIGIGVFTIIGLEKALVFGINPAMAAIMGLFSAVVGGIIRDTLSNEIPLIFKKEIYATACLLGAGVFLLLNYLSVGETLNTIISIGIIIIVRIISVRFNLSLPRFSKSNSD